MHGWLARRQKYAPHVAAFCSLNRLSLQSAVVDPLCHTGATKVTVGQRRHLLPHPANFLRPADTFVQHAGLGPEAVRAQGSRREKQVHVVIALVPLFTRRVDRCRDGNAVAVYQETRQFLGQLAALRRGQLCRQGNFEFPGYDRVAALLRCFRCVPQQACFASPRWRVVGHICLEFLDTAFPAIVVRAACSSIVDRDTHAIGSCPRGALPTSAREGLQTGVVDGDGWASCMHRRRLSAACKARFDVCLPEPFRLRRAP